MKLKVSRRVRYALISLAVLALLFAGQSFKEIIEGIFWIVKVVVVVGLIGLALLGGPWLAAYMAKDESRTPRQTSD